MSSETVVFAVHRPDGMPAYDEGDKARVTQFLPHLQRALRLRHRLGPAGIAGRAALHRLDHSVTATLVVSRDCRILYASPGAEALLRAGDGVQTIGGRLATVNRPLTERLTKLIAAAIDRAARGDTTTGGVLSVPRESGLPLSVLVAPLRAADHALAAGMPSAILSIRDPEAGEIASKPLQSLFGLTPAEAAIASALAAGKALDEIAASSCISPHTARMHVKSIFAKTGTRRQGQLIALLLRSVAGIASHTIVTHLGDGDPLPGA